MVKKVIIIISFSILVLLIIGGVVFFVFHKKINEIFSVSSEQEKQIEQIISQRRQERSVLGFDTIELFNEKGIVRILFIGLDNRIGQSQGHCDAIQMIEINKNKKNIVITAVPRGTYSPLPGSGHQPTDYYIAKACEVGGLEYGVRQIEKILSQKADYVVFLGFSQAMGIFRQLDLPANETMQWLRLRQGYAIGEPQRARNHSTFIKQMILDFAPKLKSDLNFQLGYLLFKYVRTDLTFEEAFYLAKIAEEIDAPNHPERIVLLMRPAYDVQDIPYDQENLNEYIEKMIKPIAGIIPENAYSGQTREGVQAKLLADIQAGLADEEFVCWAFNNYLWLQIDDDEERGKAHYDILEKYVIFSEVEEEKKQIVADYVIEKEDLGQEYWAQQGRGLLAGL